MRTRTIVDEIAELRAMNVPALVARYEALFGKPPRVKHKEFLWKRCAWRIQELRFGGLSEVARRRLDELIAELDLPFDEEMRTITGKLTANSKTRPTIGTSVDREWRGQHYIVRVVEGGFEWDGKLYRSLSAVAKAITGVHWNGRQFFGLSKSRRR